MIEISEEALIVLLILAMPLGFKLVPIIIGMIVGILKVLLWIIALGVVCYALYYVATNITLL